MHSIDKAEWAVNLVSLLSGKALDAYSRTRDTDSVDYDKIKQAILRGKSLGIQVRVLQKI